MTQVTPDKGATVGGSEIVLTGDNFSRVNTVRFGNIPASSFSIESNTRLRAIVPVQAAGTVSVTVASPEGQSNAVDFTYTTLPAIANIAPNKVSTLGGASVVITGSSFVDVMGVSFDGQDATSFTVDSATQITATVPAATDEGDVTVTVSTVVGPSNAADLTYAAPPSVNALNPGSALTAGGASITLTGTNFMETTSVSLGDKAATSFTVNSDTRITAVVPAAPKGTVELKVTSPYGSSAPVQFTYTVIPAPILISLSPNEGPAKGGTSFTLTGENLADATSVSFGGEDVAFTQDSDTQLTASSPAGTGTAEINRHYRWWQKQCT